MSSPWAGSLPRRLQDRAGSRSAVASGTRDKLFRRLLLAADVMAALLAVVLGEIAFGAGGPGRVGLLLPAIVPFVYTASGLYRRDELVLSTTTLDEAPNVFQAAILSTVIAYLAESVPLKTPLGAQFVGLTIVSLLALTLSLRAVARSAARRLTPPERCLLIGDSWAEQRLRSQLAAARAVKAEIVGREPIEQIGVADAGERSQALVRIAHATREHRADRVIIAADLVPPGEIHETLREAKRLGVKVSLLPRLFEAVGSSVAFDYLGGLTLLGVRRAGLTRRARVVKRTFDIAGSLALLLVLGPLLAAIAVAIRISSPGPVLFRQTRVGRDGRRFQMLKFRSMVADADNRKTDLLAINEADGLFKIDNDPRVTRVGRLLRRSWLDELPQLFNVLRGDMSLVGPRPLVVDEDEKIVGWYRARLDLTPGMTGPWQVFGAARVPLRDMVTIDYVYVANWSLWGDIKLLLRTVPPVLARRGQ
jgi:exopolysaccharide biosynthesis polyprenyl glycosylphosphotransferase